MNFSQTIKLLLCFGLATNTLLAESRSIIRPNLKANNLLAEWTLDGSGTWEFNNGSLVLSAPGKVRGAIRRPAALAILKGSGFTDVIIDARIRSTDPPENPRADILLVFGYRSPTEFYYVHLSGLTDRVHNGIFIVNKANRRRIDAGDGEPQLTDRSWHQVRLVRDDQSGRIEVYMDGAEKPGLVATDTTFVGGRAGFGSFDDTCEIKDIVITGQR
jgi:hypothetical protein